MENISAEFLEKEGVQFNQSRTQAMISKIAPGEAVRLQASVQLPETLVSQELINEVTVITAETGEKEAVSQARVQVFGNSSDRENHQETDAKGTGTESRPASSVPKTGDETEGLLWLYLSVLSAAAVFSLSGRLRKKVCGISGERWRKGKIENITRVCYSIKEYFSGGRGRLLYSAWRKIYEIISFIGTYRIYLLSGQYRSGDRHSCI